MVCQFVSNLSNVTPVHKSDKISDATDVEPTAKKVDYVQDRNMYWSRGNAESSATLWGNFIVQISKPPVQPTISYQLRRLRGYQRLMSTRHDQIETKTPNRQFRKFRLFGGRHLLTQPIGVDVQPFRLRLRSRLWRFTAVVHFFPSRFVS